MGGFSLHTKVHRSCLLNEKSFINNLIYPERLQKKRVSLDIGRSSYEVSLPNESGTYRALREDSMLFLWKLRTHTDKGPLWGQCLLSSNVSPCGSRGLQDRGRAEKGKEEKGGKERPQKEERKSEWRGKQCLFCTLIWVTRSHRTQFQRRWREASSLSTNSCHALTRTSSLKDTRWPRQSK